MAESVDLTALLTVLGGLVAWLEVGEVPGMVIGGVAASLLGRPRLTRDARRWVREFSQAWRCRKY